MPISKFNAKGIFMNNLDWPNTLDWASVLDELVEIEDINDLLLDDKPSKDEIYFE